MFKKSVSSLLSWLSCFFCFSLNAAFLVKNDGVAHLELRDVSSEDSSFKPYRVEVVTEIFAGHEFTFTYLPLIDPDDEKQEDPKLEKLVALFKFEKIVFGFPVSQNNDYLSSEITRMDEVGEYYLFSHDFNAYISDEEGRKRLSNGTIINPWSFYYLHCMKAVLEMVDTLGFMEFPIFMSELKELVNSRRDKYWVTESDGTEYFDLSKLLSKCKHDVLCECEKISLDSESIKFYQRGTRLQDGFTSTMSVMGDEDNDFDVNYHLGDISAAYNQMDDELETSFRKMVSGIAKIVVKTRAKFTTNFSMRFSSKSTIKFDSVSKGKRKRESDIELGVKSSLTEPAGKRAKIVPVRRVHQTSSTSRLKGKR